MKKVYLAALVAAAFAPAAWAQSSVEMYGIVDAAIRTSNNEGTRASGSPSGSSTRVLGGGGMSESRWGINVKEDLGGGLTALANLEQRLNIGTGATTSPSFQQSWVGLQSSSFGRLTMGRQYNILFDLVTSTYASFPYSPYMQSYKPEIGFALGARTDNAIKYVMQSGPIRGSLQYSRKQSTANVPAIPWLGATTPASFEYGDSAGGYLRYADAGFAAGIGYMQVGLPSGNKAKATTLGASYTTGPWYFNAGYAENKLNNRMGTTVTQSAIADYTMLDTVWGGQENGGIRGASFLTGAEKRRMFSVGVGYQITPQLNLGGHYYRAKQYGTATPYVDLTTGTRGMSNPNATANFLVVAADYALSKRTDLYAAVDYTKVNGGASLSSARDGSVAGAQTRTGFTIGMRHRF